MFMENILLSLARKVNRVKLNRYNIDVIVYWKIYNYKNSCMIFIILYMKLHPEPEWYIFQDIV